MSIKRNLKEQKILNAYSIKFEKQIKFKPKTWLYATMVTRVFFKNMMLQTH